MTSARLRLLLATAMALMAVLPASAEPFRMVLVGDNPNGRPDLREPAFDALISRIEALDPRLVIHVGDVKGGDTPCSNDLLAARQARIADIAAPVLYTPGDNEWSDCFRVTAAPHDARDRLAFLRGLFFAHPDRTLGRRTLPLAHQGAQGYPENARLQLGPLTVNSTHVVGSNNNLIPDDPAATAEFHARSAAAVAWLEDGFAEARARGSVAVVVALHADLFNEGFGQPWDAEIWQNGSGFKPVGEALVRLSNALARPVLLVHGDGHRFGMSRPLPRRAPHLMAVETFGVRDVNAVEILFDPSAGYPFAIRPLPNGLLP